MFNLFFSPLDVFVLFVFFPPTWCVQQVRPNNEYMLQFANANTLSMKSTLLLWIHDAQNIFSQKKKKSYKSCNCAKTWNTKCLYKSSQFYTFSFGMVSHACMCTHAHKHTHTNTHTHKHTHTLTHTQTHTRRQTHTHTRIPLRSLLRCWC